ncbi:hypothetical protein EV673_0376 [Limnobacter thiooxidans]|uniref:Uncharacterized protein n=1 Tax=Limnobacter thiooxidans TaxID=131080 RepID=A0AA86JL16_9BURK|nr:hypothetical protein EV673_0376 [Limnobacter thiooxidans]BET26512.1 hypothetical protein RGQ30_20130 [Limnobacter thiooxidans]
MFLAKYLTEYDDRLTGESYIDPLGMLIIWTSFGQKIFNNRVNSISNDVRNYTLNLFNHFLVRRIIQDEKVVMSKRLSSVYGNKDSLLFKQACLLHLENIFVFSVLEYENEGVDSTGVLGIANGRRRWNESQKKPTLVFSHEQQGQILVRQLGLGVSGRYKTPLLEIGYFDRNYNYHLPNAETLWQEAEQFFFASPLQPLADLFQQHIKKLLHQDSKKPEINFSDLNQELRKTYAKVFSSSEAVGKHARNFWLKATGLDQGAAGALLKVLDNNLEGAQTEDLTPQRLMAESDRAGLSDYDLLNMAHIEQLEPFLADVTLLFTLMTHKKSQLLKDVIEKWDSFERNKKALPNHAKMLKKNLALLNVVKGTARARLDALLELADAPSLRDQVELLVEYHGQVMSERNQAPWLRLDGDQIKLQARPMSEPCKLEWPLGAWYHSYYLPQFQRLVRGYQGGMG